MRVWVLFAAAGLLGAQEVQQTAPPDDDVTAYLRERRAIGLKFASALDFVRTGEKQLADGQYRDAEENFRKAMAIDPNGTAGIKGIADVYVAEGRKDEAVRFLRAQVQRNPSDFAPLHALIDTAIGLQDFALALGAVDHAPQRLPREDFYTRIADAFRAKGDLESAIATRRKAYALAPQQSDIGLALAKDLVNSGHTDQANRIYRALLGVDPTDPEALGQKLRELLYQPYFHPSMLTACVELLSGTKSDDPEIWYLEGLAYERAGENNLAVLLFQSLVSRSPEVARYHWEYAQVLLRTGDVAGATEELKNALEGETTEQQKKDIQSLLHSLETATRMAKQ